MKKTITLCVVLTTVLFFLILESTSAQEASLFHGLKLRNICPSKTGGRIADIAVDPNNRSIRYAAVASGNVWRTRNAGTTWEPIFENYGSYSTGTIEIDPNNSDILWLGTGENNAQRSVGLGDGIYKSVNGGDTWKNMGLKTSEHIGKIVIDPRNSEVVYVASQGGVWAPGGERGLYKTTDGGETWNRILHISEDTGISDIIFDPRNPDIILVSSYQRRRHFGMLVAGGPDGGVWKTTDAGANWKKLSNGLPGGDLGRIGLAISPQKPNVVYALIAGTDDTKGFYRSENQGENWVKMSDYMNMDAQYYMEVFADPHQFDRIITEDVFLQVSDDGGKTFRRFGEDRKHVDNHEVVFDPNDPNYLMVGCDGGIYETWDQGKTWMFTDNLPLTQFYRVGIDNAKPFYNVYGGTQDNATLGGPSQTINSIGIKNSDWFTTIGGDGFQTRVDPDDPNILYSQYQYAGIVRYDKRSGEKIDIQPQPGAGEPPLRWNWDSPLIISPHQGQRLYFAANKVFRSDDRGDTWRAISGDLTRQLDRNKMQVMGKVWGVDAVFKNVWTSPLGTIVALDESPVQEGLIYAGTDEGLIQVTEDGGENWQRFEDFPGIPKYAYLSDLHASRHNANVVFAVFNNHKYGDFKPYILKSEDKGKTWKSISSNLPEKDFTWTLVQDHENPNLLFVGTEYGLYFSLNGGDNWIPFKSGIPTMAIRDLEIHKEEDDLVAASFGRGFFILDDYAPLRYLNNGVFDKDAAMFPVKDALQYQFANPDSRVLGHSYRTSPNPEFGAVFTYYLKEGSKTLKQKRKQSEKEKAENNEPVYYADWKDIHSERREEKPMVLISVKDKDGNLIRKVSGSARKGINRVNWDLRHQGANPEGRYSGPFVAPGTYTATLSRLVNGQWEDFGEAQSFGVIPLNHSTLPAKDPKAAEAFSLKVNKLRTAIRQFDKAISMAVAAMQSAKKLSLNNPQIDPQLYTTANDLQNVFLDMEIALNGDQLVVEKMELIPPSINSRINRISRNFYQTTSAPTNTQRDSYAIAEKEYKALIDQYNVVLEEEVSQLEAALNEAGVSFSTGLQAIK